MDLMKWRLLVNLTRVQGEDQEEARVRIEPLMGNKVVKQR